MICPRCGTELADNVVFCSRCGLQFTNSDYSTNSSSMLTGDNAFTGGVKAKRKPNVLGICFGILFMLAAILPYCSFTIWGIKSEIQLIEGSDGLFYIALGAIAVISALNIAPWMNTTLLVFGGLSILLAAGQAYHVFHEVEYASLYSREIGYVLSWVGSFGILFSALHEIDKRRKAEGKA